MRNARIAYLTLSNTFSSPDPFFFPLPTNMCFCFVLQPSICINSSKSRTLFLQHDHPLLPSWKMGCPGWCTHSSPSLDVFTPELSALHPLLLHVAFGGIGSEGLSESDSGSGVTARGEGAAGTACGARAARVSVGFGCLIGMGASVSSVAGSAFSGAGVSSTVECLPVVHGGISRNSSNVRTRGLQHFQPGERKIVS